jgi:hypothetical protein
MTRRYPLYSEEEELEVLVVVDNLLQILGTQVEEEGQSHYRR